jgi:hypothetical protein
VLQALLAIFFAPCYCAPGTLGYHIVAVLQVLLAMKYCCLKK